MGKKIFKRHKKLIWFLTDILRNLNINVGELKFIIINNGVTFLLFNLRIISQSKNDSAFQLADKNYHSTMMAAMPRSLNQKPLSGFKLTMTRNLRLLSRSQ